MTEPGPDPDKRKTVPVHGIGQPHAARGRAEAYLLLHTMTVPRTPAVNGQVEGALAHFTWPRTPACGEAAREKATGTDMASGYRRSTRDRRITSQVSGQHRLDWPRSARSGAVSFLEDTPPLISAWECHAILTRQYRPVT